MIDDGEFSSPSELSRYLGISRARVTQVLNLQRLSPKVIDTVLRLGDPCPSPLISERALRPLLNLTAEEQLETLDRRLQAIGLLLQGEYRL